MPPSKRPPAGGPPAPPHSVPRPVSSRDGSQPPPSGPPPAAGAAMLGWGEWIAGADIRDTSLGRIGMLGFKHGVHGHDIGIMEDTITDKPDLVVAFKDSEMLRTIIGELAILHRRMIAEGL